MTTQRRPFLSFSVRLDGVWDVITLLALAGSWLGLLGRWHWLLDLFSHFRWQYLLLAALAVLWSWWRKRRTVLGVSIATLVLNAWLIGSLWWHTQGPDEISRSSLRIVSFNVLTSNRHYHEVIDHLQAADADILFLVEIDDSWAEALEPLKASHPHHLFLPRQDNFGLALLSRLPLLELRKLNTREAESEAFSFAMPSIEARLSRDGQELTLIGTHPLPPVGKLQSISRNSQLTEIARYVQSLGQAAMVLGDLNSTPWCEGMRSLRSLGSLDFRATSPPWQPTWRVNSVLAIPIDHVLCTPPLVIVKREIGSDVGSDHRAQIIDVGWPSPH
jgi:endonuclease/exonuclease/phosphatase (EEP) superfamily protein YafD